MRQSLRVIWLVVLLAAFNCRIASSGGMVGCGTSADTTHLHPTVPTASTFAHYRSGLYGQDLTARDIEYHWDSLYDTGLSGNITAALNQFARTLAGLPGICPLVRDANNLQAFYNYFRSEGADWNASNPRDSTALRVGNVYGVLSTDLVPLSTYTNADRAHVDVYISRPGVAGSPGYDGRYPSQEFSSEEDATTGHSTGDIKHANAIWLKGPFPSQAPDTLGVGWTAPGSVWRTNFDHETQHSLPGNTNQATQASFGGELWSAGAEAVAGIPGASSVVDEVPYTWSLMAWSDPLSGATPPTRGSGSNYQARTAFMAYLAYKFPNGDTTLTLVGMRDDLLYRWAHGNRDMTGLRDLLGDGTCQTCAAKRSFQGLSNLARLNVLHHSWRVANFVNNPTIADSMLGYPPGFAFSPASNQRAWQTFDAGSDNDIIAIPATVIVGPNQALRETTFTGERSFRGSTYPLAVVPLGSNYWTFRADPQLAARDQDLVIRVSATAAYLSVVLYAADCCDGGTSVHGLDSGLRHAGFHRWFHSLAPPRSRNCGLAD